jgi:hypothetical protein
MLLSAKDLEERSKTRKNMKKELYKRILVQLCRKIDMNHTLGNSECTLRVPEFIFGYPAFDTSSVTLYMYRQLVNLGYRTSVINSVHGILYVAWGKKPVKKSSVSTTAIDDQDDLPSLANLKKAADTLRKKYDSNTTK